MHCLADRFYTMQIYFPENNDSGGIRTLHFSRERAESLTVRPRSQAAQAEILTYTTVIYHRWKWLITQPVKLQTATTLILRKSAKSCNEVLQISFPHIVPCEVQRLQSLTVAHNRTFLHVALRVSCIIIFQMNKSFVSSKPYTLLLYNKRINNQSILQCIQFHAYR